ncbi:erythromycin esterase family protein [Kutzneria sp. 744]|uniref:erythromycin esterase family protein n=1 Tax=Kutzneria sp. (strain 744) TaxID=345341 RepID=UPI0003EEA978|nr:erythromycin esterase family protein [Kutzneria sp. 744]EWM11178.1 succinoglycan biosynthesis protein [Kutzneria sp. 744]
MPASTTDTLTQWINDHAHPLTTADPGSALTDLSPLRVMVGDASLAVLGVSLRDTHELAGVSHRILRFLVEELGFRSLAIEGDDATSALLDEYVVTGTRDPGALLANARPFLRTGELLDAVNWVRRHNQRHPADAVRIVHPAGGRAVSTQDSLADIERLLAENVIRWHEQTGHKIVYWGGIGHTANSRTRTVSPSTPPAVHRSAGSYLRESFGSGHLSVGLTFHHGSTSYDIPAPPAEFAETTLGAAGLDAFLLDLRDPGPAEVRTWLDRPTMTRLIGPSYDPDDNAAYHLSGGSLAEWFDVIVHWREVTPARYR